MQHEKTVPISDCFMHQFGRYRAINSSANGANDASFRSAYFPNACDLFTDEFFLVEVNMRHGLMDIKWRCVP
jgi:hypothetical protein